MLLQKKKSSLMRNHLGSISKWATPHYHWFLFLPMPFFTIFIAITFDLWIELCARHEIALKRSSERAREREREKQNWFESWYLAEDCIVLRFQAEQTLQFMPWTNACGRVLNIFFCSSLFDLMTESIVLCVLFLYLLLFWFNIHVKVKFILELSWYHGKGVSIKKCICSSGILFDLLPNSMANDPFDRENACIWNEFLSGTNKINCLYTFGLSTTATDSISTRTSHICCKINTNKTVNCNNFQTYARTRFH